MLVETATGIPRIDPCDLVRMRRVVVEIEQISQVVATARTITVSSDP
jgi:hypothetical protein